MSEIINLGDRIIDESGNVVYFIDSLIELLYNGEIPSEILYPKENQDVLLFNKLSYENFDDIYYSIPDNVKSTEERKKDWFYPSKYDEIDLYEYFLNLCTREEERERVINEIQLYQSKGFEKFLRFCIFLSDKIKENNWVIGCGRGSSCCSYALFLIRLHLVDSLKYNLDINDFLK